MNTFFKQNMSQNEQCRRVVVGAAILAILLAKPTLPAWIALVALYPLFTALVSWCPLNAMIEKVMHAVKSRVNTPAPTHTTQSV